MSPSQRPPAEEAARAEQASHWCLRQAEGPLGAAERLQFEQWLGADPDNARAFERAAQAWRLVDEVRGEPELVAVRRAALKHLQRTQARRWRAPPVPRTWGAGLAAMFVAALLGVFLWLDARPQRLQTGVGERQLVRLDDGSQVLLDADTRVDVRLGRDRRELWLRQGRARFEVARDALRPFSVAAADTLVVATGTEFSVELVASQVHLILYEGSVEVLGQEDGRPVPLAAPETEAETSELAAAPKLRLQPGSELVAGVGRSNLRSDLRLREIDAARTRTWESGQLVFNDEPLDAALERVNRYSLSRVRVEDPSLARLRISGTFAAGDSAAFVEGVAGVFALRAERRGGDWVLARPE